MGTGEPARGQDALRDGEWSAAGEFARWRGGDPAALEELVRRLSPRLWHLARTYGLGTAGAEDAVQLAWLALVRHADSIREPAAMPSWITTVTRREAARLAAARNRELTGVDPATLDRPEPDWAGPHDRTVASAEARSLWSHFARLSARCQHLLRVIAFDDRPDYQSLAGQLGMRVGSIGPTRRRCLEKLRALLAGDAGWSDR